MKHNVVKRMAVGALSASLAIGGLPTAAIAEQLSGAAALKVQDVSGSWRQDGGAWSYVKEGGGLATGWRRIGGSWFLFDAGGAMLTGWQLVSGTWYFLSTSTGRMYENRWYWDGASWYWLGADGAMATGWTKVWADWFLGVWDDSARVADKDGLRAQLLVEEAVDPAATSVLLRIDSDIPFAEQLSTATLRASADWEGATVESVKRTTSTSAEVLVSGLGANNAAGGSGLGSVAFDEGSFADASATGVAAMSTLHSDPSLLDILYSDDDGAFYVSLYLGSAQLIAANDASAFSFPDNPNIQVTAANNLPYDYSAVIAVKAPGATPFDQLVALATAIVNGGIEVKGTSAGTVVLREDATNEETGLNDATPAITAYIERGNEDKGYRLNDDGSASIDLIVRAASTGAIINLTRSTFRFADEELKALEQRMSDNSIDQVKLTILTLSPEELAQIEEMAFYMDVSNEEILDILVYMTAARMADGLSSAGGIFNEYGVELPADEYVETTAYNLVGLGDTIDLEEGAFADEGDDAQFAVTVADQLDAQGVAAGADQLTAQAKDPNDANFKRAQQAFKTMGTILQVVGNIANAFGSPPKPGSAVVGIGILFNFIGDQLGQGISSSWSINDVMNRVIEMDGKVDAITAQLGDITHQLDKIEASIDYKTQVGKLTALAQQAMRYRPWVMRALNSTSEAPDRLTYKLGDNLTTSVTGKALRDLYTNTTTQSSVTGGGNSTAKVALDLAHAIVGDPITQQTSAVKSFFDYTAACVNWEPETFYARQAFTTYIGNAFVYAYCAASNELNHQIYYARDNAQKAVYEQTLSELIEAASKVDKLIGAEGSLVPATTDRTDGKVLCTVNNKLYKKSSDGLGAIYAPLRKWDQQETKDTFEAVLTEREEDEVKGYNTRTTMSRSDFETMAKREAYVRTIPGYDGASSIRKEMELVGLLPGSFSYPGATGFAEPHAYNSVSWQDPSSLGKAIVGNATQSDKRDASSRYHKRWYSADMYDIDNNKALGSRELYYVNVDYMVFPARWKVYVTIQPVFEMKTS